MAGHFVVRRLLDGDADYMHVHGGGGGHAGSRVADSDYGGPRGDGLDIDRGKVPGIGQPARKAGDASVRDDPGIGPTYRRALRVQRRGVGDGAHSVHGDSGIGSLGNGDLDDRHGDGGSNGNTQQCVLDIHLGDARGYRLHVDLGLVAGIQAALKIDDGIILNVPLIDAVGRHAVGGKRQQIGRAGAVWQTTPMGGTCTICTCTTRTQAAARAV